MYVLYTGRGKNLSSPLLSFFPPVPQEPLSHLSTYDESPPVAPPLISPAANGPEHGPDLSPDAMVSVQ